MNYGTMLDLVPMFCQNPQLHDDGITSIPVDLAWKYLKETERDTITKEDTLYRVKNYQGHWYLRRPFNEVEYDEFRLLESVMSIKLRLLEDRRADTLIATKDIDGQTMCKDENQGLSIKRYDSEFPGRYDEVYICDPLGKILQNKHRYMYKLWTIDKSSEIDCPFCESTMHLLENKTFEVEETVRNEEDYDKLVQRLKKNFGISGMIRFPIIFYVKLDEEGFPEQTSFSNILLGGYEELLSHVKNN